MKKISLLILIFIATYTFADDPTEVKSKIDVVTVFLDGAEIINTAEVKMSAGQKQYVFTGLSTKMRAGSVNVTVSGDVSIVSIVERINYMDVIEPTAKVKTLNDSLETLNYKLKLIANEKGALYEEKNLLISNESLGGANTGVNTLEIQKAADFIFSRMKDIANQLTELEMKETKLWEKVGKINNQLAEMNAQFNQPKSEVVVTLNAHSTTTGNVKLRYLVTSAGWSPTYDLIVEDIAKPIELKYRANVFNNTGIDWKDVKMKLSTADPLQSISKPVLQKWVLNNNEYDDYNYGYYDKEEDRKGLEDIAPSVAYDEIPSMPEQQMVKDNQLYQAIEVSLVATTFEIKTPYTIPSDAKPYLVDIKTEELPAQYSYYSAPNVDESAFLLGRIIDWEDLNLVEGDANIYLGDTYLGKSHIYTQNIDDTLDLSLGRDEKVMITREKLKEYSSKQFFGSTKKETFTYEITIKNNQDKAIDITMEDQVPVSEVEGIEVEVLETSDASVDENTGILTWKMNIKPGETKTLQLSFAIKHPKNQKIEIRQNKVRYCPRF